MPYLFPEVAEVIERPLPKIFILLEVHMISLFYVGLELESPGRFWMWVLPQLPPRRDGVHGKLEVDLLPLARRT